MSARRYPDEERYLEETVGFIDREIEQLRTRPPEGAPYKETAKELVEMGNRRVQQYESARSRPYFGRVDVMINGGKQVKGYIGVTGIAGADRRYVYDWRAPFAAVYYESPDGPVSYAAPGGEVEVTILLKRQYAIADARLHEVTEVFRRPPSPDGRPTLEDAGEDMLARELGRSRTGELKHAVATLRPEQYQQVAASRDQVMLIQGVAGSGKSVVGLHRVAFLLSPLNPDPDRISESRVVIFGPSRTFLRYVANLLPSIDVHNVFQTTVSDWLTSTLSERIFIDRREPLLEKLLRDRGENWRAANRAAMVKASLHMARVQEHQVKALRSQYIAASTSITLQTGTGPSITVDSAAVRRIARALSSAPLNVQREGVIGGIVGALWDALREELGPGGVRGTTAQQFREAVQSEVERQVTGFWPKVDFRQAYRDLIAQANTSRMVQSSGLFDAEDVAALSQSLPRRPTVFAPEDLGALAHFDHLLNGHAGPRFDHMVLDEAQEISPIELLVIKQHSRNNALTILGDLTQSLAPQGIGRWREVLQLFRGASVSRHVVRVSYRSTAEITRYTNRLLKKADPRALTAIPVGRHGPSPSMRAARSYDEMVSAIASGIVELETAGAVSIGILCKSTVDARKLHRELRKHRHRVGLLTRDETIGESVVVAPIHVTRGLEYDAVVLAGVSRDNYPDTPLHSKLLYVGASRAAHFLHVHWVGQPATQLGVRARRPRQGSQAATRVRQSAPRLDGRRRRQGRK